MEIKSEIEEVLDRIVMNLSFLEDVTLRRQTSHAQLAAEVQPYMDETTELWDKMNRKYASIVENIRSESEEPPCKAARTSVE
eukprot:8110325-Pyramimonas_sp.AAC.1